MIEDARFKPCTGVDDRRHAVRASRSCCRNVAEGYALGPYGRYLLLVASGGAAETKTCARLGAVEGVDELVDELQVEIEKLVRRADRLAEDNATRKAGLLPHHRPYRYTNNNPRKTTPTSRAAPAKKITSVEGYPPGVPWEFRFEDTPFGLPQTYEQAAWLQAWMRAWSEEVRRKSLREKLSRNPTWPQEN